MKTTKCNLCLKPILFGRTEDGRPIALNPTPDPAGTFVVLDKGGRGLSYSPHASTCRFRRVRRPVFLPLETVR